MALLLPRVGQTKITGHSVSRACSLFRVWVVRVCADDGAIVLTSCFFFYYTRMSER